MVITPFTMPDLIGKPPLVVGLVDAIGSALGLEEGLIEE